MGFFLVLAGLLSYVPIFALFPITRDFPWANLLILGAGGVSLGAGLKRAFRQPELYRGKVFGPILAGISALGVATFAYGLLYEARKLPPASEGPRVGQQAPAFTLPDQNGRPVALADLFAPPAGSTVAKAKGALLIFYRGYW
jgi:hypothetical protein